jgi:anti-sigma factor RsiW
MRRHLGERLSALIDGELSHAQRERVLAHLARCESCRREAGVLRLLKRRMHALGDGDPATGQPAGADALTWRLLALVPAAGKGPGPQRPIRWARPGAPGRRRTRWLVTAALAGGGLGLSVAAFLAGGDRPPAGPKIIPAVDVFMEQHAITTGQLPVPPSHPATPSPAVVP